MTSPTDSRVDVLATLDAVARGCALHADNCVGERQREWTDICTDGYDKARAAVAELIRADREYDEACELAKNVGAMSKLRKAAARRAAALARLGAA